MLAWRRGFDWASLSFSRLRGKKVDCRPAINFSFPNFLLIRCIFRKASVSYFGEQAPGAGGVQGPSLDLSLSSSYLSVHSVTGFMHLTLRLRKLPCGGI